MLSVYPFSKNYKIFPNVLTVCGLSAHPVWQIICTGGGTALPPESLAYFLMGNIQKWYRRKNRSRAIPCGCGMC